MIVVRLTGFLSPSEQKFSKGVIIPKTRAELINLAMGNETNTTFEVEYEVDGIGTVLEATITKCKNGVVVIYADDYMRRRDPDCLLVADKKDTDKPKYDGDFEPLRIDTFEWLKKQELIFFPFKSGGIEYGYDSILIAPSNAGFFAAGLADLQGFLNIDEISDDFNPRAVIFLAPPFRHTHFEEKQIVIHNRLEDIHEVYSYNLYPGPSAKKGIYGVLLNIGEEGWITATQQEVGLDGYDAGAKILTNFFEQELMKFNTEELNPLGRQIIDMFFNEATVNDYMDLIPMRY